jgi:hypothetical protein
VSPMRIDVLPIIGLGVGIAADYSVFASPVYVAVQVPV